MHRINIWIPEVPMSVQTNSVLVSKCPTNYTTVILPIIQPQQNHSLSMTQCYNLLDKSKAQ